MKLSSLFSIPAVMAALITTTLAQSAVDKCRHPGQVALTFDDGPGQYNAQLLTLLDRKKIKATFFMIGEMITEDPAQAAHVKKMYDAGHQLASHTFTHPNLDKLTPAQLREEMKKTSDAIFKQAGVRVNYMRAPQGVCGPACMKIMTQELNQTVVYWNVDTNDWRYTQIPPATAVEKSMKEIREKIVGAGDPKKDSFIVLEHEIHKFSVELLAEKVIDAIAAKGFTFVTMEECHGVPAYSVDNNNSTKPTTSPIIPSVTVTGTMTTTATSAPISPTTPTGDKNGNTAATTATGITKTLVLTLMTTFAFTLF